MSDRKPRRSSKTAGAGAAPSATTLPMPRARQLAVSLLAVLGLLSALGWSGASLAAPMDSPAVMAMAQGDGCGGAISPNAPIGHDQQLCAICCAVLPSPLRIAGRSLIPATPLLGRLQPLSGIDPGLDPPPPRAA